MNPSESEEKPQIVTNLTVNDLAVMKQIIDVATRRGTFTGSELTAVGVIYDRITACLSQFVSDDKTSEQETPAVTEAETSDVAVTDAVNLA